MKKVAILTFHRALNYGAKLQAFALMTLINAFADSYILDYRCKKIEEFYYNKSIFNRIKEIAKVILFPKYMNDLRKRRKCFNYFDSFYKFSKAYFPQTVKEADSSFDVFLAGSDQIWNPEITGYDLNYFLPFCKAEKRNSYAASLGKANLLDFNLFDIKGYLEGFRTITVRESSMVGHIKSFFPNLNPISVCDPVFLLTGNEWKQNLNLCEKKSDKKYIFIYIVAMHTNAVDKALRIAEKNGWGIKYIDHGRIRQEGIEGINDAGPIEFLNLMLNAELIITTSFHAFALSMIFHKPVQFELSKEKVNANSRLIDLANRVNMMKYEIKNIDDKIYDDYDWNFIDKEISFMRTEAIALLKNMIN